MRRTVLKASPETQALLNLLVLFGQSGYFLARALRNARWDYEYAGRILRVQPDTLRQRMHRLMERAMVMLHGSWEVPVRRRARMRYVPADRIYAGRMSSEPEPVEVLIRREEWLEEQRRLKRG